ncbi:hypothetical protein ALC57_00450 [Trachymyrmex cornetzi]|uniref:Uncharacterized protein n=1 Tax=Trachymyrmex cornetzi TaxID=471704 RepID=A0A151JRV5_9HYME|nr:hypothetical protein ALC57_00450 [Trachymyrmex cornetzi]
MFNIFHKIFYFRSGTLQTAENLQVLQSTAGRGKGESKGRIEGSYTSMARCVGVFVATKRPVTPDRREIQSRKKESAGIRKGKGKNDMSACCITAGAKRVNYITRLIKLRQMPPGGTDHRLSLLAIRSTLQERLLEALLDIVCPSSRTSALLFLDSPNKADPTFLKDVKVPLALNHIANVLLVKCKEMTRHIESGVEGYGYAAIQTDCRVKDAVEIAEGDAALRLVVDEEA